MPDHKEMKKNRTILLWFLFGVYVFIRYFCTQWLESLWEYASYFFELVVAICSCMLINEKLKFNIKNIPKILIISTSSLMIGLFIYRFAFANKILIPFDLTSIESLVFLLIVAPVLEEGIFRFFLWKTFASLNIKFAFILTTIFFSYSHFHAYWFFPQNFHQFIFYQTIYTLILSLLCGYSVWKYNSLVGSILIHFAFNLGFYLGSLY